ncbi:OmpA family protein [Algibacter sp.]|nr:OmpA family protein [Algibacter sp.]
MKLKKNILFVLLCANIFISHSQTQEIPETLETPEITEKDSTIVSSWIVGLGINAVDDSDHTKFRVFDVKDAWNSRPYPSRVSIGKYFKSGLGLELISAINKYKEGKIVEGVRLTEDIGYFSIDSRLSYDLNKVIGETGWFDPYVGVGLGYTDANNTPRGTYNAIFGFRTWLSDRVGLDFNTSGKWTMDNDLTNHIQHVVGVVYRFKAEKELTKKGQEKLDLIKELEKETNRINDSIALVNKLEEEKRLLADQLEKEKEEARLAQIVKEKAKEQERKDIQNAIDALEDIYFGFDLSNITSISSKILDNLISILNKNPELVIEITSHTDSRGNDDYNKKLSERRLKSTLNYLFKNGIAKERIVGGAYGEEKLTNECDNNTKCFDNKHNKNRRSEIKIISF